MWEKPAGRAAVGFHLQHLTGVLDRMLTYASGKELSEEQFSALKMEGDPSAGNDVSGFVAAFDRKVDHALQVLSKIEKSSLTEFRSVGRKKLPSSVIGLLFHAAEHTQRHVGQLLVTASVVKVRPN
ncbi:DinB family protein [Antarcticibacterium sp. 1MA-6-2]|uniref:DinB family protein n=1 Tax=Antarcticibacterium sp. 1MA-6-2 TaxID=2908210 RepID=UPI002882DD04|nr:DinB family protein [Antarcticibacterium sp. 1MA-6-2]